jgi:rhodanese-related sulfurtransferase
MGPLVPEIIGNELNLVVALFIGIAFGFVLEQAGFSTSKKLVGLFYGYDFTVLRVFFTAGVTAMIGVIALNHFGLIDISLIYVNPTFLWSAIVGGLIMGLGFVVGGFCPGTSICAAAIGKIDAMVFIAGSFLGVLVFAEGYPMFEQFYKAENWGNVRIFETLGMSQGLFAFFLTFVAVFAFWVVSMIENKVNGRPNPKLKTIPIYVTITGISIIIGLTAFIMPDRKEYLLNKLSDQSFLATHQIKLMTTDELAFRIIDEDQNLQIIDVRNKTEFDTMSLPNSIRFEYANLFEKDANKLLSIKHKENIFVANDELTARKAAVLAQELGYTNLFILEGGINKFKNEIIDYKSPVLAVGDKETDTERFRAKASTLIPELIQKSRNMKSQGDEVKPKRVVGGC